MENSKAKKRALQLTIGGIIVALIGLLTQVWTVILVVFGSVCVIGGLWRFLKVRTKAVGTVALLVLIPGLASAEQTTWGRVKSLYGGPATMDGGVLIYDEAIGLETSRDALQCILESDGIAFTEVECFRWNPGTIGVGGRTTKGQLRAYLLDNQNRIRAEIRATATTIFVNDRPVYRGDVLSLLGRTEDTIRRWRDRFGDAMCGALGGLVTVECMKGTAGLAALACFGLGVTVAGVCEDFIQAFDNPNDGPAPGTGYIPPPCPPGSWPCWSSAGVTIAPEKLRACAYCD